MSPATLLLTFFLFVVAAVSAAGYVFVLKPARAGSDGSDQSGTAVLDDERDAALDDNDDTFLSLTNPAVHGAQAAVLNIFQRIGDAVPPTIAHRAQVRQHLLTAGYRWPTAVSMFLGIKVATAFTLAVTGIWLAVTFGDGALLLPGIGGFGFGFLLPDRVLERLAISRSTRMRRALPSALDLMVLAVEAGQGIDAAILETSRGLRLSYPDLAGEFTQMHLELRAGTARGDALRDFGARAHDQEIRKFVSLMLDTDRFGSSLGPALRTHTHYLRTRFRQKAQEKARKVAVKLIFPVFFLIFPSVILVTLGPAAIMIFTQLSSLMGQ